MVGKNHGFAPQATSPASTARSSPAPPSSWAAGSLSTSPARTTTTSGSCSPRRASSTSPAQGTGCTRRSPRSSWPSWTTTCDLTVRFFLFFLIGARKRCAIVTSPIFFRFRVQTFAKKLIRNIITFSAINDVPFRFLFLEFFSAVL